LLCTAASPSFAPAPENQKVVEGHGVTFTCRVYGAPKPQLEWRHESTPVSGRRFVVHDSGDLEILVNNLSADCSCPSSHVNSVFFSVDIGCPFPKNPTPLSPLTRIIGGLTTPNMMGWIRLCLLIYCRPTSSSTVFTALLHFLFNFVIDAWFSIQYCLTFLVSVKLEAVWKASLV